MPCLAGRSCTCLPVVLSLTCWSFGLTSGDKLFQPVIVTHVLHLFQDVFAKPTPAGASRKEALVVLSKL